MYNFHTGLFTENCFVLAEGFYEDEVFHVSAFGFPPPEPARITRYYIMNFSLLLLIDNLSVGINCSLLAFMNSYSIFLLVIMCIYGT